MKKNKSTIILNILAGISFIICGILQLHKGRILEGIVWIVCSSFWGISAYKNWRRIKI